MTTETARFWVSVLQILVFVRSSEEGCKTLRKQELLLQRPLWFISVGMKYFIFKFIFFCRENSNIDLRVLPPPSEPQPDSIRGLVHPSACLFVPVSFLRVFGDNTNSNCSVLELSRTQKCSWPQKWRQPLKWSWPKNWRRPQKLAHPPKTFPLPLPLKNYLKFFLMTSHLTMTATPQLMLNQKWYQAFKDDCTLTKHTRYWTYSALQYFCTSKSTSVYENIQWKFNLIRITIIT